MSTHYGEMTPTYVYSAAGTSLAGEVASRETKPWSAPGFSQRLSGKILTAFKDACDNGELEVAAQLLHILEKMMARQTVSPARIRHQSRDQLIAAQQLLWQLRHKDRLSGRDGG